MRRDELDTVFPLLGLNLLNVREREVGETRVEVELAETAAVLSETFNT